ncbi:MAG: glycosyl transferase, family 2, partial [Micrococcaceae bacterium]|nr:glycosyl transferase, family 2 [Micrococcaceae bacterium]
LVSGQARIVSDDGRVLNSATRRRDTALVDLFSENQVTGSLSVLRRDLLPIALPFPLLNTPAQYHDHWLGVCAGATHGVTVVDAVVQDYIQHGGNVVGENRTGTTSLVPRVQELGRRFEGSASPRALARFLASAGIGWRRLMGDTLKVRVSTTSVELAEALAAYSSDALVRRTLRAIIRGTRAGSVPPRRAVELIVSLVASAVVPGRPGTSS